MITNSTIILPAKNEAESLSQLLPVLSKNYIGSKIIVVNDGSSDNTVEICEMYNVKCISHPYSMGNGAAIKTGARAAETDILIFMDADAQHKPEDITKLLEVLNHGYEMVVGARNFSSQAGKRRLVGNALYNKLASLIVGKQIKDLTSGFRAVKREKFLEFIHLLPNGFSYPTTITMAFFRNGYSVAYTPIITKKRPGKSHLKLSRDGIKFLLIIFKVGVLYSPLKIFVPVSALLFALGVTYYAYTFISSERFTNMSALLLASSLFVFLMGLISEQITTLVYSKKSN